MKKNKSLIEGLKTRSEQKERFTAFLEWEDIFKMATLSKVRYKFSAIPIWIQLDFLNGCERMLDQNISELIRKNKAQEHKKKHIKTKKSDREHAS